MLLYRLRLFVVGGEHNIAMAMVVVGHMITQPLLSGYLCCRNFCYTNVVECVFRLCSPITVCMMLL